VFPGPRPKLGANHCACDQLVLRCLLRRRQQIGRRRSRRFDLCLCGFWPDLETNHGSGYQLVMRCYGADWTAINPAGVSPEYSRWGCIASSADGSTLVALPINGDYGLYGSTNAGTDWVVRSTQYIIPEVWISKWIALSADGARMAIVYGAGADIWTNYLFADWPVATGGWFGYPGVTTSVSCSADGSKLVALHNGQCSNWDPCPSNCISQFRYSWDFGVTWPFECEGTVSNLTSVASSADGTHGFAVGNGPMLFATTNSGVTWDATAVPDGYWISVACSADGAKAIAAVRGGGVYVGQVVPAPVLKALGVGDSVLLSWTVPSRPFRLEANPDLTSTNWREIAAAPTLNYTNLNLEISVAAPQGRRFYRLALPNQ
jgi:hypothetical protein